MKESLQMNLFGWVFFVLAVICYCFGDYILFVGSLVMSVVWFAASRVVEVVEKTK